MSHGTLSRHVLRAVVGRASARHHVVGHVAYTDKHSTPVAIKLNIQPMVFRQYDIKVENTLNVAHRHSYKLNVMGCKARTHVKIYLHNSTGITSKVHVASR